MKTNFRIIATLLLMLSLLTVVACTSQEDTQGTTTGEITTGQDTSGETTTTAASTTSGQTGLAVVTDTDGGNFGELHTVK